MGEDKINNTVDQQPIFPAAVAHIVDARTIVINRGKAHQIKEGQRFLVYAFSKEQIVDPESGRPLGYLEIVKGTGKVIHVQDQISTIESDKTMPPERSIVKRKESWFFQGPGEVETITPSAEKLPFDKVAIGDKAKPI